MRTYNYKKILIFVLLFCLFYAIIRFWKKQSPAVSQKKSATVLWWTEVILEYHRKRSCGLYNCVFTGDRKLLTNNEPLAIAFYGSDINATDLPIPRSPNHIWALLHEESPKNVAFIQFESVLQHFNITATFSRYSSFPLTTQYIDSIELLTSKRFLVPIGEKTRLRKHENLAPVAFIQSICDTMSGRQEYVKELMKYIQVDSYGKCLNNKKLPDTLSIDYLQKIDSDEFYKFISRYKFIISYENGVCDDYITEKFWRPLIVGSVPIYFGSPTIKDWMPNEKSAILIRDFDSPAKLAAHLKHLDENDYEYNKYLDHKYSQLNPIKNALLKKSILERNYKKETLFEDFECFLCEQLYLGKMQIADQKHYDCGAKLQFPKMKANMNDLDWHFILKHGKCEATVLNKFLLNNKNYSYSEFNKAVMKSLEDGFCKL